MSKARKIHLKNVADLSTQTYGKGFNLTFYDFKKNLTIIFHLERWWISYIAEALWKVVKSEQDEINRLSNSLKNGEK